MHIGYQSASAPRQDRRRCYRRARDSTQNHPASFCGNVAVKGAARRVIKGFHPGQRQAGGSRGREGAIALVVPSVAKEWLLARFGNPGGEGGAGGRGCPTPSKLSATSSVRVIFCNSGGHTRSLPRCTTALPTRPSPLRRAWKSSEKETEVPFRVTLSRRLPWSSMASAIRRSACAGPRAAPGGGGSPGSQAILPLLTCL